MSHQEPTLQQEQGWMTYPEQGVRKLLFKLPIYLWRMGLARLTPSNFLLLTTQGRKSALPRRTMLEYSQIGERFYLASGWGARAQWFRNALAAPLVTVQTAHDGTIYGRATRVMEDEELTELYDHMSRTSPFWHRYLASWGIEPTVEDFLAKKERLAVLRVEPADEAQVPALAADLLWLWPLLALAVAALWGLSRRATR